MASVRLLYVRRTVKRVFSEAAANEVARRPGKHVEPLNDARTRLEALFTIR